jgi:outer membrane lipoprotein-sorting protein
MLAPHRAASCLRVILVAVLLVGAAPGGDARAGDAAQKAPGPGAAAANKPTFDDLYAKGQVVNKNIKTLTARFVETTTNALLREDRPIVTRGTLYVERPSRVAMQYTEPADQRIVIDGKWMTTTVRGVTQKFNIEQAQKTAQKYFVEGDAGDLRRMFDIDLRDKSSRPGTREVFMVPTQKRIKQGLSKLELWVGEESALLNAMRMTFANGDTKLMEFENVVPNAVVDPAVFKVAP